MAGVTVSVAVVTGGGRGLGRGIALALAGLGLDLVLGWATNRAAAEETADAVRARGGGASVQRCDVRHPEAVAALAAAAVEVGPLEVWVNNAGVSVLAPVVETTPEQMADMMAVNFLGTFHGVAAAARAMMAGGRGGRIINVASDLGLKAAPLLAGYSATKFAVVGLGQAAAVELAPHGITVNSVCPGTVETDMVTAEQRAEAELIGSTVEEVRRRLLADVPAGRFCTPEDVGALVAWLGGAPAEFVTGQAICTNGGSIPH